ncbi:MAG: GntR family transcriptional regulator [Burkholderiaceae bacterium]|nr:GntR family transcriptional regulator [Burkholderiaceae bacterium]
MASIPPRPPAPLPAPEPDDAFGDTGSTFSSISVPDLVGVVEAQLQQAILAGRIAPGERIVEAELARQMGVSRAPVREAARRLESLGLLVSRPRHGFTVRDITLAQVNDLYQVRRTLELMAAELACQAASDAQLAALMDQVDAMVRDTPRMGQAQRVATDLAFHQQICALSGNAYLLRLFANMNTEVRLFLALSEDSYGDPASLAETHRPIAAALQRRDVAAVRQALGHHLDDAVLHVRSLFTPAGTPVAAPRSR